MKEERYTDKDFTLPDMNGVKIPRHNGTVSNFMQYYQGIFKDSQINGESESGVKWIVTTTLSDNRKHSVTYCYKHGAVTIQEK